MGNGLADQLRDKALLALEEITQQCRYRAIRRCYATRFALAYLWALRRGEREPFDAFWRAIGDPDDMWRFSKADYALLGICHVVGVARDEAQMIAVWKRVQAEEARRG